MKFCSMFRPPNLNPDAATAVNCIVNEVNDCVFKNICKSLNTFWKFCLQIWKFLKFFETFKVNANKHFENLNESYNFLLLSIIIAGWGLGYSPSFAIVPGIRKKASPFPSPPLVYTVQCTMELPNFPNFQSNANKYAIDLYCISTRGGKIMRVVLTCHAGP